jgi:serine protease
VRSRGEQQRYEALVARLTGHAGRVSIIEAMRGKKFVCVCVGLTGLLASAHCSAPEESELVVSALSLRDIVPTDASEFEAGRTDGSEGERGLSGLRRRRTWPKSPVGDQRDEHVHLDRIVFKIADNVGAHVIGGRLTRDARARTENDRDRLRFLGVNPSVSDSAISALMAMLASDPSIRVRAITEYSTAIDAAREEGERRVDHELADVSAFAVLELPTEDRATSERWLRVLRESPIVEHAYMQPRELLPQSACTDQAPPTVGVPASRDQLPRATMAAVAAGLPGSMNPNISNTLSGHDVAFARTVPGSRGIDVPIYDIENGYHPNHEKLPNIPLIFGTNSGSFFHGTQMLGILVGCDTPYGGFVGYADRATAFFSSLVPNGLAAALNAAANHSPALPGRKVILLEYSYLWGPNTGCFYPTACGCGPVPVEIFPADFSAIQSATASGFIVVEPSGNGSRYLDDLGITAQPYGSPSHSGAIMTGSVLAQVDATGRHPINCDTNAGSRNDLSAWVGLISTAGVGVCNSCTPSCPQCQANGADVNQWYTDMSGGTSGASAIVAASVASLVSMTRAASGENLYRNTSHYRGLLRRTAIPESTVLGTAPRTAGPTVHLGMAANVFAARALGDDTTSTFNSSLSGAQTGTVLWVAGRGSTGTYRFNRMQGGAWDGWTALPQSTSSISQLALVAASNFGPIEAWAVDAWGNLLVSRRAGLTHTGSFPAWSASASPQDLLFVTPAPVYSGFVEGFAVTFDGQMRWYYEDASNGVMYTQSFVAAVPKTLNSRVVAVPSANRCDLFAIDVNQQLIHGWIDAAYAFHGWTVVDTATTASSVDAVWHQGQIFVAARYAYSRLFTRYNPANNTYAGQLDTTAASANVTSIYLFPFEGDDSAQPTLSAVEVHSSGATIRSRIVYRAGAWSLGANNYHNWSESTLSRITRIPFQNGISLAVFPRSDGRAMGRVVDPMFPLMF